jgi:two-component system chemotaxis response regulator CheB
MTRIRVLIVDDAVVVRRMLADALGSDPEIEVAGVAANGRIGLARIPQVNPDLVTLDMEMPELDGVQTVTEIRKLYPRLPVIMFSTLTARGASTTLEALAAGANDYVTKPANVGSVQTAMQRVRDELIPKVKALCGRKHASPEPSPAPSSQLRAGKPRPATAGAHRVEAVVIGVSTGGPNALAAVLPHLPGTLPVPLLIVQHMPPMFTRMLAERLASRSNIVVTEAQEGDRLTPGKAWLAPGDYHMTVVRSGSGPVLRLNQGPPENSCRPAADVLFRSAAEAYRGGTLAVVLTGMGQDGLRGCEVIHDVGGQVLAQDEASSVVWGMPGFVAKAGLADQVLPLERMAPEIIRLVGHGRPGSS